MTALPESIRWYEVRAGSVADNYEAVQPEQLHGWLDGLHSPAPGLILDVGAGSGRDAAWLAGLGHDVVAVEPASALRAEAARRHPGAAVLSGVWQHVLPADRARALRKLLGLLRPGGVLAITLRHGPSEPGRGMHPVSLAELEALARQLGAAVVRVQPAADEMGRPEVS